MKDSTPRAWYKKKNYLYILGGVVILVIGILTSILDKSPYQNVEQETQNFTNSVLAESDNLGATNIYMGTSSIAQVQKTYDVIKVVDGDTIDVSIDGKVERVRLIGINTPETVDPRKSVECFGIEASNKAKASLTGKKIYIESDTTQGERDKYSRLLKYVFLVDGTNFNLLMIKEGYAYEYTYGPPYKYQLQFKQAQKDAQADKRGLWAEGVCEEKQVTIPITTTPKLAPTPSPKPTPSQCNQNYSGCLKQNAGDYDCASGSGNGPNYTGAVQVLGYDEYQLDRDGDGWACEN